jgi:hypothetical protein
MNFNYIEHQKKPVLQKQKQLLNIYFIMFFKYLKYFSLVLSGSKNKIASCSILKTAPLICVFQHQ